MENTFLIDNHISVAFFEEVLPEMLHLWLPSGFAIATIFIFLTYGVFKAFTFFRSFT